MTTGGKTCSKRKNPHQGWPRNRPISEAEKRVASPPCPEPATLSWDALILLWHKPSKTNVLTCLWKNDCCKFANLHISKRFPTQMSHFQFLCKNHLSEVAWWPSFKFHGWRFELRMAHGCKWLAHSMNHWNWAVFKTFKKLEIENPNVNWSQGYAMRCKFCIRASQSARCNGWP